MLAGTHQSVMKTAFIAVFIGTCRSPIDVVESLSLVNVSRESVKYDLDAEMHNFPLHKVVFSEFL